MRQNFNRNFQPQNNYNYENQNTNYGYSSRQQDYDTGYSGGYSSSTSAGSVNQSRGGRNTKSWGKPRKPMAKPQVTSKAYDPPARPPPGQYLAKTPSELNNDPLSEKAYFPAPSEEFRRIADRQKLFPGCEAMTILTDQMYTRASCLAPSYGKTVPKSAHDYYFGVLMYYRLLQLEKINGRQLTYDEAAFVEQIQSSSFSTPKSFNMYISGFGNTKIPRGRELEFALDRPNLVDGVVEVDVEKNMPSRRIPGFFGPIEQAIGPYSSYPATGVLAQRILEDLIRVYDPQRTPTWNLPATCRSERAINPNCIGYHPAIRLSTEHQAFFSNINVSIHNFEFDNESIALNLDIMTAVHQKLSHTKQELYPLPTCVTGSVGQICMEVVTSQTTNVVTKATFSGQSTTEMPSSEG